jgi:hypothetical protein
LYHLPSSAQDEIEGFLRALFERRKGVEDAGASSVQVLPRSTVEVNAEDITL